MEEQLQKPIAHDNSKLLFIIILIINFNNYIIENVISQHYSFQISYQLNDCS